MGADPTPRRPSRNCVLAPETRSGIVRTLLCVGAWIALTGFTAGCPRPIDRTPLPPLPLIDAAELVNANIAKIDGTLRAAGSVDGYFTRPDGSRQSYHLDGVLFYLAPSYVRFDLKALGDRQFLFGCNAEAFWYFDKSEAMNHCAALGDEAAMSEEIPVRADRIVDAFGLTPIPADSTSNDELRPVPRVEADVQQVLFIVTDGMGGATLEKEYWLDRHWPRLVRRVLYRDQDGVVTMESHLSDYRPLAEAGPLLPHDMSAEWPDVGSQMRFRVSRWEAHPEIGPDNIQFRAPRDCRWR